MKPKKDNIMTLDQFKDKHYGKPGNKKRDQLETDYENFKNRTSQELRVMLKK